MKIAGCENLKVFMLEGRQPEAFETQNIEWFVNKVKRLDLTNYEFAYQSVDKDSKPIMKKFNPKEIGLDKLESFLYKKQVELNILKM